MCQRLLTIALCAAVSAWAPLALAQQDDRPFLNNPETFGRPTDDNTLRVCIDLRDPLWEIDREIAQALAAVLLLEPEIHLIDDGRTSVPLDDVYSYLRGQCRVYFGFRLVAGMYPSWASVTRAYYDARYVFVTDGTEYAALADIPAGRPVGVTLGSSADFRFTPYNNALSPNARWTRRPYGTDAQALAALENGDVEAALVWGPALVGHQGGADFSVIAPDPLQLETMPVGGLMLSGDVFLRQSLDEGIAAMLAGGEIERAIADRPFLSLPE